MQTKSEQIRSVVIATTLAAAVLSCEPGPEKSPGAGASAAAASTPPAAPALPPATDTITPGIPGVVAAGTKVSVIKDGFNGTEGPVAHPDGSFLFTETRANRINRIDSAGNVTTFLENTNGSNALAFDKSGKLYSVQTTPGNMKIGIIFPAGSEKVLADNFDGKPFARPNDMVLAGNGAIYFSDFATVNPVPDGTLAPAVYYIAPGSNKATKAADGIARPNGVQLTLDEKTLLVNDMFGPSLLAFDIKPDGSLANRRNFAAYAGTTTDEKGGIVSGADGLAVDSQGRVYAATRIGVQVFAPDGKPLGVIPVSRPPQNIAFAGAGKKTLYIVGNGAAYKVETLTEGFKGRAK
jgi:gluconolactonase